MHDSSSTRVVKLVRSPTFDLGNELTVSFISDLHLLSSRHDYGRHEGAIRRAVQSCDVCIWGGDLFDFHWSCEGDGAESRKIAIDWLQAWRDEFPEKCFVYLNGNHDAQAAFQDSLARWAGPHPIGDEWEVGPGSTLACVDAVRIGDCLFLHGDVIEATPRWLNRNATLLQYRKRWDHERVGIAKPPMMQNRLYNTAVRARLHLAAAGVAHRRRNVCLRLLRWVGDQPAWVGEGVNKIVFGHTHRRLDAVKIAGVEFYNAGAAVRHVGFAPVTLRV